MNDRPDEQPSVSDVPPSDELPEDEIIYSEISSDEVPYNNDLDEAAEEESVSEDQSPQSSAENGNRPSEPTADVHDEMGARLERLGGEPAPDITPEEFARLQQSGQIHIDPRGRVRSGRQHQNQDAGVSLRKRRAWYQ